MKKPNKQLRVINDSILALQHLIDNCPNVKGEPDLPIDSLKQRLAALVNERDKLERLYPVMKQSLSQMNFRRYFEADDYASFNDFVTSLFLPMAPVVKAQHIEDCAVLPLGFIRALAESASAETINSPEYEPSKLFEGKERTLIPYTIQYIGREQAIVQIVMNVADIKDAQSKG